MADGRRSESKRLIFRNGRALEVTVVDGFIVDDLIIQGAKAEGYRVVTGRDEFPTYGRELKDYLIRTGVILD